MSTKCRKNEMKPKKSTSTSSNSGLPIWLQDNTKVFKKSPTSVDPWLSGNTALEELSNSSHTAEEDVAFDKSESSISAIYPGEHAAKKAKRSSGINCAPNSAAIPALVETGPLQSTANTSSLTNTAAPPALSPMDGASSQSDSAEDIIIDDCTFSDSGDLVPPETATEPPEPSKPPVPVAGAPFGLAELVPVSDDTVLLTTAAQFCLLPWGAYQVRVLCGAVRLHGATLTPARDAFVPVFALRVKALPTLRPAEEELGSREAEEARLSARETAAEQLPAEAAAALRRTTGCAMLLRRLPNRLLTLLAVQHGETFAPRGGDDDALLARTGCRLARDADELQRLQLNGHQITAEWEQRVQQLTARSVAGEHIRVAFAGGKGVGKSTWLYYVLNTLLNTNGHVYVLDLDPGQAEFTPCACLSLVKVDTFIVGPAFTHLTKPVRSVFLGEVSVASDPVGYMDAVRRLTVTYRQLAADDQAPLLINTMGWAKGLGEDLLLEVLGLVQPTDMLEIVHPLQQHVNFAKALTADHVNGAGRSWLVSRYLPGRAPDRPAVSYRHSRLTSLCPSASPASRQDSIAPWMYRQLNTTAFVVSLEQGDRTLCQLTPVCVPWSSLAIHVTTEQVLPYHLMHAINGTVVALCTTDPSHWLPPDDRSLFSLLPQRPQPPDCVGFGVVRGVDPDQRLLYLLTDLPASELSAVNTLVRGPHHLLDVFPAESGVRCWTPALTGRDAAHTPLSQPNQRRKVARSRPGRGRGRIW